MVGQASPLAYLGIHMALRTTSGASPLACLIHSLLGLVALTTSGRAAGEATMVRVSVTPVFPAIPWAHHRHDFDVLVRVEAPAAMAQHAPIDLVAVLDVSESMNAPVVASFGRGPSTRLHLLKKAIRFVISKLDDSDRLAIVAFNDRVAREQSSDDLLPISGRGGCRAKRMVDGLVAGGTRTSFKPALERAVQILDERDTEETHRAGFVILVSDGKDDSGIKWWCKEDTGVARLLGKYPVHTFGLSASHDPRTLHSIAVASYGTYSFADDEDTDSLTGALAVCLGGLKTVVAAHTRIVLTAAEQGGAAITGIESGGYSKIVSGDGRRGEIVPGVLYAGEVRNFIVRLHVPGLCAGACGGSDHHREHKLLTVAVVDRGAAMGIDGAGNAAVILHILRPQAVAGAGWGWQAPSPEVVSHIALFELVDLVSKFVSDVDLDGGGVATAILGDRLEREWEEFNGKHRYWSGVDGLVGGLESDIRAMASSLRRGAAAYIHSWVSSYRMQRATTMGSPGKVVPGFMTPAMALMLKEAEEFQPQEPFGGWHPTAGSQLNYDGVAFGIDLEMVDQRLELWYKLKREVPILFRQPWESSSEGSEWNHLSSITQQAALEAIDRAMHNEIYLAVVHASNVRRRCYSKRLGTEPAGTGTAC